MTDLPKKQIGFDTSSGERKLMMKTEKGAIVDLTYLDKASNMTDLEKLKAVFDDIGVDSLRVGNGATTEYLSLERADNSLMYLNFKDGKFTHID